MSDSSSKGSDRVARAADAQALLAEVGRTLGPTLALESTLKSVLQAMRKLVDFRGGSIALVEHGYVRTAASDPLVSDEVLALRIPVGQGIVGRVVANGETIYSPDIGTDGRVDPEIRRTGSNRGMVSYLAVPLVCLGRPIGVLQVDSESADAFDEIDIMLLEGLATQTATAIESARQYEERLHLDAVKHGFINLVSHELRTPLTIATGMLQAAGADPESLPDSARELLDRASVALDRLGRLIEELIMMSQLTAGAIVPRHDAVSLRRVAHRAAAKLPEPELVDLSKLPECDIRTDESLLEVVLVALFENASTYAGGCEVAYADGVISVVDHGPGLPEDVEESAAQVFSRSSTNPTTVAGLGLGLGIATAVAAELGGELRVSSERGVGTTVDVVLPR